MTLGDVLALVAGVALAYFLIVNVHPAISIRSPTDQLMHSLLRFLQGVTFAVSAVSLARIAIYRRMPTAPEWLAILVAMSLPGDWPWLQVDHWVPSCRWAFPSLDRLTDTGVRWLVAGQISVAIAIGLGGVRLGRAVFPAWIKTLALASLALLAMSGPLWVFSEHGADLITPGDGFGPGVLATLHREACLLIAACPIGILFGLPAVAALSERISRCRWTWAEWAAIASTLPTGLVAMMSCRGEFRTPSPAWLAERILVLAWFAVITIMSLSILTCFQERSRLWIEGPIDHGRSAPEPASEPSIHST